MRFEEEYRRRLFGLRDEAYYDFNANLVPGSKQIGIRIPVLKGLAKEFLQEDYEKYLTLESKYNEEKLIKGFIIAGLKDFGKVLKWLEEFVKEVDNWAVCDSTACALKIFKKNRKEGLPFIASCLDAAEPFQIRFGLVLLLAHYLDEEYLDFLFAVIEKTKNENYYVRMALAWMICSLYVKFPERTLVLLDGRLDKFTHNKAISKIRDSYMVGKEEKENLKKLRK